MCVYIYICIIYDIYIYIHSTCLILILAVLAPSFTSISKRLAVVFSPLESVATLHLQPPDGGPNDHGLVTGGCQQ